jgi:hypothetical protein
MQELTVDGRQQPTMRSKRGEERIEFLLEDQHTRYSDYFNNGWDAPEPPRVSWRRLSLRREP